MQELLGINILITLTSWAVIVLTFILHLINLAKTLVGPKLYQPWLLSTFHLLQWANLLITQFFDNSNLDFSA